MPRRRTYRRRKNALIASLESLGPPLLLLIDKLHLHRHRRLKGVNRQQCKSV